MLAVAGVAQAETFVIRGATMGTTYQIKFPADADADREQIHAEVEQVLAEIDRQMSTYRPDSELSRFNRAAAGAWFAVSKPVAEVVAAARAISEQTDGAMDVTVGPLVKLWHFGPADKANAANKRRAHRPAPPTEAEIAATRERVGYKKLEVRINPPALRKAVEGLEVDLNSIAPGYSIDRITEVLQKRGIENSMVELGGEVRARGVREDGQPWRIAVERPTKVEGERELQSSVPLENASIATAGEYRNFFEADGHRYSHIMDPTTGRSVERPLASVTVVAEKCIDADGWDTPLWVLGPERGIECATKHNVAALYIWLADVERGTFEVRATPAWEARFGEARQP